jgi:hypothetical protein
MMEIGRIVMPVVALIVIAAVPGMLVVVITGMVIAAIVDYILVMVMSATCDIHCAEPAEAHHSSENPPPHWFHNRSPWKKGHKCTISVSGGSVHGEKCGNEARWVQQPIIE